MKAPKEIMVGADMFGFLYAYDVDNHPKDCTKYIRADLTELTWEDLEKLDKIMGEVWHEAKHGDLNENFYQEVLRRFLESKKEG